MKILSWIFILAVLFYIGEDSGQIVSGIQGELNGNGIILEADVRTYLSGYSNSGFNPAKSLYKIGIGYNWFRIFHECKHNLDLKGEYYPPINYIKIGL